MTRVIVSRKNDFFFFSYRFFSLLCQVLFLSASALSKFRENWALLIPQFNVNNEMPREFYSVDNKEDPYESENTVVTITSFFK